MNISDIKREIIRKQKEEKYSIKLPLSTSEETISYFYDKGYGIIRLMDDYLTLFWGNGVKENYERFNEIGEKNE
jgi:hypothetical protein